jgi:DNA polymerase V
MSACEHVSIFFRTSPFSESEPYYCNQISAKLPRPTDDTRELLHHVTGLLPHIWRDGFRYQKGGVILGSFTPRDHHQVDLFDNPDATERRLMAVIDEINLRGLGHVGFAAKGVDASEWMMKREHLSPRYTTSWEDLPIAR